MSDFTNSDSFIFVSEFILIMGASDAEAVGEILQTPTLNYLKMSENSKVRQVLHFFHNYPEIIVIETSKMGNPYHIINRLAELYEEVMSADLSKRKERTLLQDRFIAGILFWGGLRDSEITYVRKRDIDLISKTFNVPTLKQRKKQEVVYKPIPLDHVPMSELQFWNYYFEVMNLSSDDKVADVSPRTVERATSRTMNMNPHALRHGLGLFLYELTKDIRLVAQVLRHKNISNTMIYTRLSMDGIREKLRLTSE